MPLRQRCKVPFSLPLIQSPLLSSSRLRTASCPVGIGAPVFMPLRQRC
jgi:hypothetical protein